MKKIIALVLCILMIGALFIPSASAMNISIDPNTRQDFETVFKTTDLTGAVQIKFDYVLSTTASVGPGWHYQSFGLFDADGKFLEADFRKGGLPLIGHDLQIQSNGTSSGTAVWTLPAFKTGEFDIARVCEFDGYLWGNRASTLVITNLRAVMSNGNEVILSADCPQAADEDQVSLYCEGEAITPTETESKFILNKTWNFDEPIDIGVRSYAEFAVGVVPIGATTKLYEGPGYYETSLTLKDDEGNTFVAPNVLVSDGRGYMNNRIWAEGFGTECETFDFTSVVSATLYAKGNRKANYYFGDISFVTSTAGLNKFGDLLDSGEKAPDASRLVNGGVDTPASFEFAFDKADLSTAYAIAYDYKIEAISEEAPAPGYHWAKAAIFDSKGNFNEWAGTSVLPNATYGSGTMTTIIPRIGDADLTDICEFDIYICINQTAIYTIKNLRIVDKNGNTVKALEPKGYDKLVSFGGEGEGISATKEDNGRYKLDETVIFNAVDLTKYTSLRFALTVAPKSNPRDKLAAGPGYFSQSIKLINTKGQAVELNDAVTSDGRGKQTISIRLNNKDFDYSCVNAVQVTLEGNREATYWIDSIEAMNAKYKWYTIEQVYDLEINPPAEESDEKEPDKTEDTADTDKKDETTIDETVTDVTETTVEDTTAPAEDDGGCGSVIAGGIALMGAFAAMGVVALRKKED